MKRKMILLFLICATVCSVCFSRPAKLPEEGVSLTIYNDNFAVVRESRRIDFEQGTNTVKFADVASAIDPTTVSFRCLSMPDAVTILEQNYEYDLVNAESLLKRYIDKEVKVLVKGSGADAGKEVAGQLLAAVDNTLIVKTNSGNIELVDKTVVDGITLKELPGDLVTRPTLVWLAGAKQKGGQLCQVTYTTGKVGWKADYSAILSAEETKIDFSGWVTIDNKSGATYKDAVLKLIAGDVRRVVERGPLLRRKAVALGVEEAQGAFEEKPFMEYYLYTLGRKSTISNDQVKQIEFITPAIGVVTKKLFIYDREVIGNKVQIKLEFENTAENNLGIALPAGKVRVFKKDPADDMLEFVGEDKIGHTARKEKLSLYIGNAFDVVPEYTLVESQRGQRTLKQTHKIELRNRKSEAVTVFVDERFERWANWTIEQSTHKYEKRDAHTARFEVQLKPDSTVTLQYSTTQTWFW